MTLHYSDDQVTLHHGDALKVARELPDGAANCIVTSPPYFGLRDYGTEGQYGLESSPAEYVDTMRALFAELRRCLSDDGTLWLNIGDSYNSAPGPQSTQNIHARYDGAEDGYRTAQGDRRGRRGDAVLASKNLLGIPWRTAFALQDDGWILRNAIIWHKPNAMPESVTDRLSGRYEHVFLFSCSRRYWFDLDPIREPHSPLSVSRQDASRKRPSSIGKAGAKVVPGTGPQAGFAAGMRELNTSGANPGDVWSINTQGFSAAHFAVMPVQLAQRCIAAGCKPGGTVLDPFSGSGTTGLAAQRLGRKYIGIDLNAEYLDLSLRTRLRQQSLDFEAGA